MSLDSYGGLDESINMSTPNEQLSEKYQENVRQAQIQLKKIQKDEKRAKTDNQRLFLILSRFLNEDYYSVLIPDVTALLSISFPSRGIIALLALFYPDATYYVTHSIGKSDKIKTLLGLSKSDERIIFDEKAVPLDVKNWVSEWIVLMEEFLIQEDASVLMVKKEISLLNGEHSVLLERVLGRFLVFFFSMRNIDMNEKISREYAGFIKKNISNFLTKYLNAHSQAVEDLIKDVHITNDDFFQS